MPIKKYLAELLGTFALASAIGLSIATGGPFATPLVAGLTLMVLVYVLGPISGAHVNPAVTLGLFMVKKISLRDGIAYIVAQVLGAAAALWMFSQLGHTLGLEVGNSLEISAVEALGAFFLVFGIGSLVYGVSEDDAAGLTVGGSLLLGIMMTGGISSGIINPALALGFESVSFSYICGPLVGGILGAFAAKYFFER